MTDLLSLQFTLFSIIAAGILLKRLGIVSDAGQKSITNLVIYAVLPCNILNSFMVDMGPSVWKNCGLIFLVSMALHLGCVFYGGMLYRKDNADRARCLRYGIICSNAGFLGNPVAEGVFGAEGLLLASVYLIPLRIMMWSEGIAIFSGVNDRKAAVKRVITHPCVVACAVGIFLMLTKLPVPELILAPVQTIGKCNTALSMLVIGMILADVRPRELLDRDLALYSLHRLVFIPLALMVALKLLGVDPLITGVSVLLAAMPAGTTTAMLADKYGCDPQFATKMIIFSTLCSIPAISLWSLILG
ncbi:MAG: AEC family transporter [Clostridia bacterium]|nr:AEC family transporter [Clostridia bacterium]